MNIHLKPSSTPKEKCTCKGAKTASMVYVTVGRNQFRIWVHGGGIEVFLHDTVTNKDIPIEVSPASTVPTIPGVKLSRKRRRGG